MSRTIDFISISIITFLLTFVWSTLLFSKWVFALIFSIAFSMIVLVTLKYFVGGINKPYSYDRLATEFSIQGDEYLINIIKKIFPHSIGEFGKNYILIDDILLISNFKFGILNASDMSKASTLAKKYKISKVYLMARGVDRRAYSAINTQNIKVSVIKIRAIYRFLNKHNALPKLTTPKAKFNLKNLIEIIFQRSNAKNYIFSGLILIAIAFLTPLKIYYLIFGSISLLLALLTLTPLGKGNYHSEKIFEKLEQNKNNQISIDELDDMDSNN